MIIKVAEYTMQEGEVDQAEQAVRGFVAAVNEHEPETFYEAYQKGQTNQFLHLMKFTGKSAEQNHRQADYTQRFVEKLYPLCSQEPTFTDLAEIK